MSALNDPLVKTQLLQVVGFLVLAAIVLMAFLGAVFTEGLIVTISSRDVAPAYVTLDVPVVARSATLAGPSSGGHPALG
jgi:hypothetical protein